ncbi:MAG: DUF342 domain-containing protein [Lachnospiraceae bacterium]|nr:DUF342 domain-containing protein [Lachnospiraceae bacterium]
MAGEMSKFLTEEQMDTLKETLIKNPVNESESYVRISEDEMEAWLYLGKPTEGESYTKTGLIDFLNQNRVVEGLISSNISAMAKKGIYRREVKVAEGKQAVEGTNGRYEFYFTPSDLSRAPLIREDGSVDYTSMKSLQNIRKGEKIALYYPAVQGENGVTVTGQEKKAELVKELPPLNGRGVSRDEENPNLYIANTDGKIQIVDNKVDIQTVHEITGDVDMLTGKVEFFGDIIVNGNVTSGVVIRAGRNLTIEGTVEGCTLYAGGDIVLKRGVQGGSKAKIKAKGNVFAEFIEYSEVKAGKDVQANIILNSTISAEQRVVLNGKKGAIIGGNIHGLCGVEAQTLGNEVEVKTTVHCGILPEDFRKLKDAVRRETEITKTLTELVDEMKELIQRHKSTTSQQVQLKTEQGLRQLNEKKDRLFQALDEVRQDKARLSSIHETGKEAAIFIRGTINRGSIICIAGERMPLDKSTSFTKYTLKNGVIHAEVVAI